MPSRKWYAVALAVALAGAAASAILVVTQLSGLTDRLHQVVVPGERELTLDEPGRYTVFHEAQSIVEGQVFNTADLPGLQFIVLHVDADTVLDISPPTGQVTYAVGGRSGVSVGSFEAPAAGRYVVAGRYPDGIDGPRGVLAVGMGVGSAIASLVLSALAVGFGSFIIAAVIAWRTWRKRRAARRAMAAPHPHPVGAIIALIALSLTAACQKEEAQPGVKVASFSPAPANAAAQPAPQPESPTQPQPQPDSTPAATPATSSDTANGAVAAAPAGAVLASHETNWPGIMADVVELRRKGSTLTATVRFRNTGSDRAEPDFMYTETYLMDPAGGKKYDVLKDTEGRYIAALRSGYSNRWYDYVSPGASKTVWIKFPAPPPEVKTITFQLPNVMLFEELPIADN